MYKELKLAARLLRKPWLYQLLPLLCAPHDDYTVSDLNAIKNCFALLLLCFALLLLCCA